MCKRNFIPCINSLNLLPNLADLDIQSSTADSNTNKARKQYAMIVLLLFYSFCTKDDLIRHSSSWVRYKQVLSENCMTKTNLKVMQNIQDCCYI